ncbi:E3 ubiquitin-protein ligase [Vigna unguiculata]|uniref:E3 ubiquitin-protein ligase n=1 Tax=Vigna unguiculata TaxID=3917 RepID=A0A4D6MNJ1_VIGUN|nr:E3 ubiquitin-protein ligase [Vigna unguiculata]
MSSEATHWCYACEEPIVFDGGHTLCPYCDGSFVVQLDELQRAAPSAPSSSHLLARNSNRDSVGASSPEQSWGLTFHGQVPEITFATATPSGGAPRRVDFGDSPSITPELQEFIHQLISFLVKPLVSLFLVIIKFLSSNNGRRNL